MNQHKGNIVKEAIHKSGYQIKHLAEKLGIARNTLYVKMHDMELSDDFIIKIGNIIHYDFSREFPDLIKNNTNSSVHPSPIQNFRNPYATQLHDAKKKYLTCLEHYIKLLNILTMLANDNELLGIKNEINEFLKNEEDNG